MGILEDKLSQLRKDWMQFPDKRASILLRAKLIKQRLVREYEKNGDDVFLTEAKTIFGILE